MSFRRLALVCGLTLADYLLWNWSVSGNHTVLALVSGLTLPFLLLASTVLFALTLAGVISGSLRFRSVRRSQRQAGDAGSAAQRHEHRVRRRSAAAGLLRRSRRPATGPPPPDQTPSTVASAPPSPASSARKRAA
jgi:hypothetical protein